MALVKLLMLFMAVASLAYLILCAWLWWAQRWLMFIPSARSDTTPGDLGWTYETLVIPVPGGGYLQGWWLPAEPSVPLTFLYLHGNTGNMATSLDRVDLLRSLGASVLAIDYRGYGQSSGPFASESRLYDDALAAYQFLHQEKGIAPENLVVYGHSLGGAIGLELAMRVEAIAALVVESSFTSMADMVALSAYNRWFPVRWLVNQHFNSLARASQLRPPVLYIHGLEDRYIPAVMSDRLYQATASPKELWLVPGEGDNDLHNTLINWAREDFKARLQDFLRRYAPLSLVKT
ncbi:MAG: alpha/beta hydrolase [Nodosilinea sp.]